MDLATKNCFKLGSDSYDDIYPEGILLRGSSIRRYHN